MIPQSTYPGLSVQPDNGRDSRWFVRWLRPVLRSQFGRPSGLWGEVVGRIMARTRSNLERTRWTLDLLDLKPDDRVLEIGFGPGLAIELASGIASRGVVAGIDHSDVMLRHAARRNAQAIWSGHVVLKQASAADPPEFDQPFDKIFTINSIHFWERPVDTLRRLRAQLTPGGLIAVTIQPRSQKSTDQTTRAIGEELVAKLAEAGFARCRLELRPIGASMVACALGTRD